MNTNDKIKFEFSKSELKALLSMLNAYQSFRAGRQTGIMATFIMKKVFLRLLGKMDAPAGKTVKMSFKPAEAVAMLIMLRAADSRVANDTYNQNVILKIETVVHQKTV